MIKRLGAATLSSLIVFLSFGPEASLTLASEFNAKAPASAPNVVTEIRQIPRITSLSQLGAIETPQVAGTGVAVEPGVPEMRTEPRLDAPLASPDKAVVLVEGQLDALGVAAGKDDSNAQAEDIARSYDEGKGGRGGSSVDASLSVEQAEKLVVSVLTPDLLKPEWRGRDNPVAGHCYAASEALYHLLGGKKAGWTPMPARLAPASPTKPPLPAPPPAVKAKVQARSPIFPAVLGGIAAAAAAVFKTAAAFLAPVAAFGTGASSAASIPQTILLTAALVLAVPAAVFLPRAVWEMAQYAYVTRRGRNFTDDDFRRFVEAEVLAGRLDGGVARLIRIYRPDKFDWRFGLGYHSSGAIALRPETGATPTVFRSVLAHEYKHYKEDQARGPPKGFFGFLRSGLAELTARAIELRSTKALKDAKLSPVERAAREAQVSLALDQPYEMLVVNAESPELKDAHLYKTLSSGKAKITPVTSEAPQDILGDPKNLRRYKAVVMEKPDTLLPKAGSVEGKKLDLALQQLDSLYLLATRRMTTDGAFKPGTSEISRYRELAEIAKTLSKGSKKDVKRLERMVKDFWHQIASTRLKGVGPADFIEKLYDGLKDKGMAFLSFAPGDEGVVKWEKLLRYWESADGGEFRAVRVDLEDGGHIMVLRKVEARVGLWLKPMASSAIIESVPDASGTPEARDRARLALAASGFSDQLGAFAKLQKAAVVEGKRLEDHQALSELRATIKSASIAGSVADTKAFAEQWLKAGIIAEGLRGKAALAGFDALTGEYQQAAKPGDPAVLAAALRKLDAFAAGIMADLGPLSARFASELADLASAARAEVEAAKSADSLRLFDEASAALKGAEASAAALRAFVGGLAALRTSLERAGIRNYLTMLDDLGVEVRDVFGGKFRQEIYVTVPRRNASAIRNFVAGSSILVGNSRGGFKTLLMDSGRIMNVPEAWAQGVKGGDATVMEIDTGGKTTHGDYGDRDEGVDMMHEGHEDWIGHRTHVGGSVASSNVGYPGMAPEINSIGAKVFSRDSPGASDGDIMGAGTIALQRAVDVINLSLGSRGNSSDNLAKFFSDLTLQKNAKGEYVIVVASAGNAGPFDESISQPAAGENVIAVAAAAKSKDDGVPEVSFYSSVGPDRAFDSAVEWIEIKPDITAIGGDVTTKPGNPSVYDDGVFSAKSPHMPATPSDTANKKHTGMSGTSMAAPMIAGIAALVKLALKKARALRDFIYENLPLSVKAILMVTAKHMGVPVWFQGAGFVDAGAAVKLALAGVSGTLRFRLAKIPALGFLSPAAGSDSWAWIERYKNVLELGRKIRQTAEIAKTEARARFEDLPSGDEEEAKTQDKPAVGDKVYAEIVQKFAAARDEALPALLDALKDPVWLVRRQAALILLNGRSSKSAAALLEAALKDSDARVRQMAWLALAKNPSRALDAEIRKAAEDPRWDVSMYVAYALAAHGDASMVGKISARLAFTDPKKNSVDKNVRYSAAWLLGQLGAKTTVAEAAALSAKVRDLDERGNIRHLAAAALFNAAQNAPAAVSDDVVVDLLAAAGPQNLALTRTISKFFPAAMQDRDILALMRREPAKSAIRDFVLANRAAAQRAGALGELVSLLAKAFDIPLDVPTPLPDPGGLGVPGVDPALGPLDVIVEAPKAAASLDQALLARYGAALQAVMPLSKSFWVRVPEHKLFAFSLEMRRQGLSAKLSRPYYATSAPALSNAASPELLVDWGAKDASGVSVVKINAAHGVSEAKVMAALEDVRARFSDPLKTPALVVLSLAGPALKTKDRRPLPGPVGELVDRLVLSNIPVVISAGNGGPAEDSIASPADAGLALAVAAAGEKQGLQFYSARGTKDDPGISWTDLVREADLAGLAAAVSAAALTLGGAAAEPAVYGTGAAARRSVEKLASLTRRAAADFLAREGALPDGFYFYAAGLVRRTLAAIPAHSISEVGAGLFLDESAALTLLEEGLKDRASVAKESGALIAKARERLDLDAAVRRGGLSFWERMKDPYARASQAAKPRGLHAAADLAEEAAAALAAGVRAASAPRGPPLAWWQDPAKTHKAVTVPLFSLRRAKDDPGVGKFTDLATFYRDSLAKQGADTILLLPHFAVLDESPYAPVSLFALNEDQIDWAAVPEVAAELKETLRAKNPSGVDYRGLRKREAAVALAAWREFQSGELVRGGARADAFRRFSIENASWLGEYAEFMALSALIGKPALEWGPSEVESARKDPLFSLMVEVRTYSQWLAYGQLQASLAEVRAAGGHVLFDIPMFRAKNSVDAWKRPELFADLKTRNPGIKNKWVNEDWGDLALWRWSKVKADGYQPMLAPYAHWLKMGFDGGRVDALHFAYNFGNGQLASGDEPGEDYVKALASVFAARRALPVTEAYEGKAEDAVKNGFVAVYGDWKKVSTHDDPRQLGFMGRYLEQSRQDGSGKNGKFIGYTLGDEWGDPIPIKTVKGGRSYWRYRIPLPGDPGYAWRVRVDARAQLEAMKAATEGGVWTNSTAVKTVLAEAADAFVKHADGSTQIWAASTDWFLEEWGRDTFVSLPGLLLSTGRYDEAKQVMRRFAGFEKDGLIPNRIEGGGAVYNTVDGPLWFVQAVKSYGEASNDAKFVAEMAPVIGRIVARYASGTGYDMHGRFNAIAMDADGLIKSPAQATWMDADPDGRDKPVTPRDGKAVEINALWYSALRYAAKIQRDPKLDELADKVRRSFNDRFWFEDKDNRDAWGGKGGALKDVVDGDPHGGAIRPNMLFAVSHGGDLLSPERQKAVVLAATRDLLTPYGLRTLSPRDSYYRGTYETWKPPIEKDQAYHQGTVWPWLMGSYLDALAVVRRDQGWSADRIRGEALGLLEPLADFLVHNEQGSLPEVFDGGALDARAARASLDDPKGLGGLFAGRPSKQNPGGTRSQAWSVAEVLRILSRVR